MSRYTFSKWLNSSGGPLVVMESTTAHRWTGCVGGGVDYELACQADGYASKLAAYDADVLVLGDEPLQSMIVTGRDCQAIVRWRWADNDVEVFSAIDQFVASKAEPQETYKMIWPSKALVMFDAAETFDVAEAIEFRVCADITMVRTFLHSPSARVALIIHTLESV